MTDLVVRLRSRMAHYRDGWREGDFLAEEAANRIEKLEAALRMTIAHVNAIDPMENKHRIEALNIARKALEGKDE